MSPLRVATPALLVAAALAALPSRSSGAPTGAGPGLTTFSYGAEVRLRATGRDRPAFSAAAPGTVHEEVSRARVGLTYRLQNGPLLYLQPQYVPGRIYGGGAPSSSLNDWDVLQGYAEVPSAGATWRLGRQWLVFGDSRLLGNGDWTAIGRSWDGIRTTLTSPRLKADLFVAKLGLAGAKTSEPAVAGAYLSVPATRGLSSDYYGIFKTVTHDAASRDSIYTFGTRQRYEHAKRLDATVEAAYQTGRYATRPASALAYAITAGYTPPGADGWRIGIEHDYASGGNPAGSGMYRTFDQLYPTNHGFYGISDYVGWRNISAWRLSARSRADRRWSAAVDLHHFALADSRDFWYGDNGRPVTGASGTALRDAAGLSGRDVGREFDAVVRYTARKGLAIEAGYARFWPGGFVRKTNGGRADSSNWFYLQTLCAL